jgi:hypothetical protein
VLLFVDGTTQFGDSLKLSNNTANKQLYIEALILDEKYTKAMNIVIENKNAANYVQNFLNAYQGMLTAKDKKSVEKYKPELINIYNKSKELSLDDKQIVNLGYILADAGLDNMSRDLFFRLAYNASPDSRYVKELIFLWGRKPWKEGTQWLTMRAKTSTKIEQLKWLKYLNETGDPKEVISILEKN